MKKKSLVALGLAIGMSLSMSLLSYASTFSESPYRQNQPSALRYRRKEGGGDRYDGKIVFMGR